MKIKNIIFGALVVLLVVACQGGKTASGEGGDTLQMKYAELLTIVKHNDGAYTEAIIENPWKKGTTLHKYILVPKGKEGDETVARLKDDIRENATLQMGSHCDIVRTPLESNVVFTAPHCQLMYELGCKNAITGVCDKDYINIPDIKERVKLSDGKASTSDTDKVIIDCGSSMQPDIERIIALKPEGLFISPFENSGGYGKLDKLHIPIIETADYMETSPLGRAEWMKFYGLLFKSEERSDSLFSSIEKEYLALKAEAAKLPQGLSILTERKMGSVWYVPGGKSTMGILLKDANAKYIFADDTHSGSLAYGPERILSKGTQIDVWAFKYFGGKALSKSDLLAEYEGYKALKTFNQNSIYQVDTSTQPYFELTSFHPEILLREFIILAHPKATQFGKLRFYQHLF
ncbi:MAG: ABC transporter substrate-binding protein [Segatella copri]|nr:ABC transporter substrate-binding protein [Segatella copri]CDD21084.1 putative exported periplasmic protein [Prevotella sp. CAG:732]